MEVDRDGNPVYAAIRALSTHDLTWRSTSCTRYDLPRRSTFQLTTSHGGRHLRGLLWSGMLAFQLTTSHGGRHIGFRWTLTHLKTFNSRPHMEVDGITLLQHFHSSVFQLTTSHGGRQQISLFFHRVRIFFINLYTNNTLYFLLCIILLLFSPLLFHFIGANPKTFPVRCAFALEQQRLRHVKAWLYSHVLHFIFISIP